MTSKAQKAAERLARRNEIIARVADLTEGDPFIDAATLIDAAAAVLAAGYPALLTDEESKRHDEHLSSVCTDDLCEPPAMSAEGEMLAVSLANELAVRVLKRYVESRGSVPTDEIHRLDDISEMLREDVDNIFLKAEKLGMDLRDATEWILGLCVEVAMDRDMDVREVLARTVGATDQVIIFAPDACDFREGNMEEPVGPVTQGNATGTLLH